MANWWPQGQVVGRDPIPPTRASLVHSGCFGGPRLGEGGWVSQALEPAGLGVGILWGMRVGRVSEVPWPGQRREGLRSLARLLCTAGSTLLASACCPGVIGPPGLSHLHEPALGPQGETGSVGEEDSFGRRGLVLSPHGHLGQAGQPRTPTLPGLSKAAHFQAAAVCRL